jgi:hypothetical protein
MTEFSALTVPSKNGKTGNIAVSTTSRNTCPCYCPLQGDQGCYAEAGYYTRIHWDNVTKGKAGKPPLEFTRQVAALPSNQMFRHNVAGDLWHDPKNVALIYYPYLEQLAKAARHLHAAWTYTHHTLDGIDGARNKQAIFDAEENYNFVVNVSTESLDVAVQRYQEGLLVTVVQPPGGPRAFKHKNVRFVQCPATLESSTITCQTCGGHRGKPLCATTTRQCIVMFPAHGQKKTIAASHCS